MSLSGKDGGADKGRSVAEILLPVAETIILPAAVIYMESLARLSNFGVLLDGGFAYLAVLSLAMGFLFSAFPMLLSGAHRRRMYIALLGLLAVWFSFHVIYYHNFQNFFSLNNMGQAADVTQFWREALTAMGNVWYMVAAFFLPMLAMCFFGRRLIPDGRSRSVGGTVTALAVFLALYLPTVLIINGSRGESGEYTPYYYYTYIQGDLDRSFKYYGIVNVTRIDLKQLIFGVPVEKIEPDDMSGYYVLVSSSDSDEPEKEYGWNIMDIDFGSDSGEYAGMDSYFSKLKPTRQNRYTGMFKGKNLIFLTVESLSSQVIDPDFTPLLYRMSTEGFVFRRFYNPMWGGSTSTGEYAVMTGNFYTNTSALDLSAKTYQPFVLGNQFSKIGYKTLAYHNNVYYYYDRIHSHTNFGYDFKAIDRGLKLKTNSWPNSDKEMADATVGEYAGLKTPFHVYYMTMSGHMTYSFSKNLMSERHRKDLPAKYDGYSEEVRAYLACQYEAELMLETIVSKLEENGNLENTVFAMAADHYPYGLSDRALSEFYCLPRDDLRNNPELYHSSFILWTPGMATPVYVDNPCTSIDILPTISNLFGLEYDSRLITGSDILAEGDHVAMIRTDGWSWVSNLGIYLSYRDEFIPGADCTLSADEIRDYIRKVNKMIKAKNSFSYQILTKDYYGHVFGQSVK